MARVDLPQSKLRRRRRRRRLIAAAAGVFAVALLVAGAAYLARAPFLRIQSIEVTGAQSVASGTIEAFVHEKLAGRYLWLFPRDNIFLYPRAAIVDALAAQYPSLREADVHAKDFHTIAVALAERQPAALWCDSECRYMDENGIIYAPAPQGSEGYVEYRGAATSTAQPALRQYLSPATFQSLSALVSALDEREPDNSVRQVVVDEDGAARAYFKDDFLLIFWASEGGGDVFERFSLALSSDPFKGKALGDFEYLDLRYGDKLYYKAK